MSQHQFKHSNNRLERTRIVKTDSSEAVWFYKINTKSCQEGRGHWAVYYTSPKSFYINDFLSVYRGGNFGDVHQFIKHCLIPLDPWKHTLIERYKVKKEKHDN